MTPIYEGTSAQPGAAAGAIQRNKMKLAVAVGDGRHYVACGQVSFAHSLAGAASH